MQQARWQWGANGGRPPPRFSIIVPSSRGGYTRFERPQQQGGISTRRLRLLAVLGAGGAVVWVSSRQEVPYTGRWHSILVDKNTEMQLGEQAFKQVLAEAAAAGKLLPPNHPASLAVRRVGSRIAAVAGDGVGGGYQDQMKGLKWEFAVIRSPEVNAFVVPGGKVVVYTGLLRMISREDELAAVLAHEVSHVLARHGAERMTQGSVLELLRMVAYWGFGLPIPQGALVAFFFLPNSRKAETEADVIGVQLAARACYDPSAAADVFAKLGAEEAKAGGAAIPKFLRTHPVSSDRIVAIKKVRRVIEQVLLVPLQQQGPDVLNVMCIAGLNHGVVTAQMLPRAEILGEAAGCQPHVATFQEFEDRLGRSMLRRVDWGSVRDSVARP